jgi:hypothetical protein
MTGRVIGAALAGAVLMYLVGYVWWGMPLGPGSQAMREAQGEDGLRAALLEHLPESGVYFVPMEGSRDTPAALERFKERHREGPVAMVVFHRGGKEPFDAQVMLLGFLHSLGACALAAGFVGAVAGTGTFAARWFVAFFLGLFVAVFVNLADLIWWSMPPAWVLTEAGYNVVGWALAGLPIAAIVKRPKGP